MIVNNLLKKQTKKSKIALKQSLIMSHDSQYQVISKLTDLLHRAQEWIQILPRKHLCTQVIIINFH